MGGQEGAKGQFLDLKAEADGGGRGGGGGPRTLRPCGQALCGERSRSQVSSPEPSK